ncbi:MAG: zinc ribbon domain-containing protein [Solirubrobacteraceae bacterium]
MLTFAYFGIESSGLNLAVDLLILFVIVLYVSLIYWTYADARRRVADPMLVGCATVASLFPFLGTIVYLVLRPPEYLEDVRERELETQAAEARLRQLDHALCPYCDYRTEHDFIRCPSCLRKLKERCVSCARPLDQAWTICPYCEADVPGLASPRSRRRRAAAALDTELTEVDAAVALEHPEPEPQEAALATEPAAAPSKRRSSGAARTGPRGERPRPSA